MCKQCQLFEGGSKRFFYYNAVGGRSAVGVRYAGGGRSAVTGKRKPHQRHVALRVGHNLSAYGVGQFHIPLCRARVGSMSSRLSKVQNIESLRRRSRAEWYVKVPRLVRAGNAR